jgi:vancomycin resistance protein YoaR
LTCKKKVCICEDFVKADWGQPLPSFPPMPSSPSDFNCVLLPKTITVPVTKTYAAVVTTPVNEQVEKIKKVYDEKMANLNKQLSQEIRQHQLEEKHMKYIITQLVNQKQELEEKLAKTTLHTKLPIPSKPDNTKPPAPSSPTLKKPSLANLKSNVKYISISNLKEALTLKSLTFIKFNQI